MTERIEPVELTGLTILLERMKTHPEEFVPSPEKFTRAKWESILNNASSFMTEDEFFKLEKGLRDCARTVFNGKVLEVLAGQGHEEDGVELKNMSASGIPTQNALLEHTRQHTDAIRKMIDNAPVEIKRNRSRMI